MPRKCINSLDAFCYICGEVTFKSRRRSFTPRIMKCHEQYFGCKVGDQDEFSSQFLCGMCQASRGMGERFTLYAFRHSYGLETAHRSCFRLLLLPDQYHWCNSEVQTHCSISKFTICNEASASQCRVNCAKAPTNMTMSDSESSDEDVGQANNMDCDPTFAGACSSYEPHLLTQGDLNDIVRDLNLSKKQAELLGCRLKG